MPIHCCVVVAPLRLPARPGLHFPTQARFCPVTGTGTANLASLSTTGCSGSAIRFSGVRIGWTEQPFAPSPVPANVTTNVVNATITIQ